MRRDAERQKLIRETASVLKSTGSEPLHGLFETRKAVEDYLGISDLLIDGRDGNEAESAIFAVADHPDPGLAAAILARRCGNDLERRREEHAERLLNIAGGGGSMQEDQINSLRRLFKVAEDDESLERLELLIRKTGFDLELIDPGVKKWQMEALQLNEPPSRPVRIPFLSVLTSMRKEDLRD